ncbi:hypothetical protein LTR33_001630 [Friedmanniomyces endolithicus]|nr:hypothetical protein LTR33_001630 [Friedmanniomyces endolithicus]
MAYDKYQEHKAEKRATAQISNLHSGSRRESSLSVRDMANGDVAEKTEVEPPSYHDAVVARQMSVPGEAEVLVHGKEGWVKVYGEAKSTGVGNGNLEVFHELSERPGSGSARVTIAEAADEAAMAGHKEDWRSKWQRKKAERAVYRAERRALGGRCCWKWERDGYWRWQARAIPIAAPPRPDPNQSPILLCERSRDRTYGKTD